MNESILKALLRLFAIVANANDEGISLKARSIVGNYLKLQLTKGQVDEYLLLFDEYLLQYHRPGRNDGKKARKRTALNSVKVLMICHEINEQLEQKEKIIVLIRLFEFMGEDNELTEKELDFVKTVADTFYISIEEYKDIKAFTSETIASVYNKQNLLIVNNDERRIVNTNEAKVRNNSKYIYDSSIQGEIIFSSKVY